MDLSFGMKVGSYGGGLKMDWSKPLRGNWSMGVESGPESQEKTKS
jgi:hypothetical protein